MLPKDRVAVASLQHLGSIKGYPILHHQCLHLPPPPSGLATLLFFCGEAKVEAKRRALEVGPRKPSREIPPLGNHSHFFWG